MRTLPDNLQKYGQLGVATVGHGSIYLTLNEFVIAVDPYGEVADYNHLPKADLILITHDHYDHYDAGALRSIVKDSSVFIGTPQVAERLREDGFTQQIKVLLNGDSNTYKEIRIEAVPAYNILRRNPDGNLFHPPGVGNGYILEIDGKRVYIAGDTEQTPEMNEIKDINIAFLPQNLPYTMTFVELVAAAKALRPKILYPYHYFEMDRDKLRESLPGIEIKP